MNALIRDLDEKTVKKLKKRAETGNRSLQAELKAILEEAAAQDWQRTWAATDQIFEELRATVTANRKLFNQLQASPFSQHVTLLTDSTN